MMKRRLPHLTIDAAVIWVLHKEQPLNFTQLAEKVKKYTGKKHEAKKWRHLKERVIPGLIEEWGILRELEYKGEKCYALSDFTEREEQVMKILVEWREEFKDEPYIRPLRLEEIMVKLGISPSNEQEKVRIESLALRHGWIPNQFQQEMLQHSKTDLRKALEGWLKHLEPMKGAIVAEGPLEDLYGLGNLDVYDSEIRVCSPKEPDTEGFNLLKQHLEIGGQEILNKWHELFDQANEFLNSAKEFVKKIVESIKGKAEKLELSLSGNTREKSVFLQNCVSRIYGCLKGEIVLDPQRDIKVRLENDHYVVEPGPLCITGDSRKAEDFAEFIRQQITSKESKQEIAKISGKRRGLEENIANFRKRLQELMVKIDDGFYLKGWCEKCKHLQKHEASR